TTYYVSQFGQYQFAETAGIFTPAISSDEFKHLVIPGEETLVLALSQSGETYDTLNALRYSKQKGCKTAAIVNAMGSSMARLVDAVIHQGSGPEICVISTKAAFAQMIILVVLAHEVALLRGKITKGEYQQVFEDLALLPDIIQGILSEKSGFINTIAKEYSKINNWLYLGRGKYYPIALESALKMKEVAYVHAEGMPAGFLKHGTIALIDENLYSVFFVPPKSETELYNGIMSSAEEIRARDGFVLGFHFGDDSQKGKVFNEEILLPECPEVVAPFVEMIIAQLFSYFTATALKRNVDKPRSLAKSVTVG
ncbi:MAG: SIS domain-containing protein, partial [Nitrospinota bacterium]